MDNNVNSVDSSVILTSTKLTLVPQGRLNKKRVVKISNITFKYYIAF